MKEIALHIYDLLTNSLEAQATEINVNVDESVCRNIYAFRIADNGCGMSHELLAKATDPYTTSRTTRRVGLGLAMIEMNSRRCGGDISISSVPNEGTTLSFHMLHNHWDRPPLGDMAGTLVLFACLNTHIHLSYKHTTDYGSFHWDSSCIFEKYGRRALSSAYTRKMAADYINDNLRIIKAHTG